MKRSKYGNKKVTLNLLGKDYRFDSKAESIRAIDLVRELEKGLISDLSFQPAFELLTGFKRNGKTHRAIKYIADFMYIKDGVEVVEDVKGKQTTEYKLKKKMFLAKFNYSFVESYLVRGRFEYKEF